MVENTFHILSVDKTIVDLCFATVNNMKLTIQYLSVSFLMYNNLLQYFANMKYIYYSYMTEENHVS